MTCDNTVVTTTEAFTAVFDNHELEIVRDVLAAVMRAGEGRAVVWLVDRGAGSRVWIVEDSGTVTWVRTVCPAGAEIVVPMEAAFVAELWNLAHRCGAATVRLVPEDSTLVASGGGVHVCVDHLGELELDEETLAAVNGTEPVRSLARVRLDAVASAMSILRVHAAPFEHGPAPFVGMKMAGGEIRFTVDWRRLGGGRYTGAMAAEHQGEAGASFFGHQVVRFLEARNWDHDEPEAEVTVTVVHHGGIDADLVRFASSTWGVAAWADRESAVRWCHRVCDALAAAGCEVDGHPRFTNSITFTRHGIEMIARIEPGDTPDGDRVRVLVPMGSGIADNLEVHREINAFNRQWSDVKLVLAVPHLFGCIDVPCGHLDRLGPAIETLVSRHIDLAPMLNVYA